jgi:hypothetical protein
MFVQLPFRTRRLPLALILVAASVCFAGSADAGKPVFQRSKPHVNVGSAAPRGFFQPQGTTPTRRVAKIDSFTWKQTVPPAASAPEFKYLPVRRYSNEVAIEPLRLAAEGWNVQPSAPGQGQIRFGDGRHGRVLPATGGHVKVFSGQTD